MISKNDDCKLVVKRGSKEALKVRKDELAGKLCKDAVKKHSDRESPGLSYEMAVPFMFHFIKFKLQNVGKHKPDPFHVQVVP